MENKGKLIINIITFKKNKSMAVADHLVGLVVSMIIRSRVRSPALPQILNVDYVWNGVHPAS